VPPGGGHYSVVRESGDNVPEAMSGLLDGGLDQARKDAPRLSPDQRD